MKKISIKPTISKREKLYAISFVVALMNTVFSTNAMVSYIFVAAEVCALSFLWASRRFVDYFGMYILFCGLSLEYTALLTTDSLYSFKNIRILGVNLGILTLLPAFFYLMRNRVLVIERGIAFFVKTYFLLQAISLFIGLVLLLFDDNGINSFDNLLSLFVGEVYQMCGQNILIIVFFLLVINKSENLSDLEMYFEAALAGAVFSLMISAAFGVFGSYGRTNTLVATNNIRWIPLLLLIPVYPKYRHCWHFWVLGLIGAFLVLANNATGKTLMIYALLPLAYVVYYAKFKQWKKCLMWIFLVPTIFLCGYVVIAYFSNESVLFNSKLGQVESVINFILGKESVTAMRSSPQNRVYEIINITLEYLHKPWLLLFGKGFMGTFKNYAGMPHINGAYSDAQWAAGLFYRVHESFSKLYLTGGMFGLFFFFHTIAEGIHNLFKTPWWLVGLYWFLISYGYSITMTALGLPCLLYSIYISNQSCNRGNEIL